MVRYKWTEKGSGGVGRRIEGGVKGGRKSSRPSAHWTTHRAWSGPLPRSPSASSSAIASHSPSSSPRASSRAQRAQAWRRQTKSSSSRREFFVLERSKEGQDSAQMPAARQRPRKKQAEKQQDWTIKKLDAHTCSRRGARLACFTCYVFCRHWHRKSKKKKVEVAALAQHFECVFPPLSSLTSSASRMPGSCLACNAEASLVCTVWCVLTALAPTYASASGATWPTPSSHAPSTCGPLQQKGALLQSRVPKGGMEGAQEGVPAPGKGV